MADVTLRVGHKYAVMTDEKREFAVDLAEDLRSAGIDVDLEIVEYEPGRRGLTFVEWFSILMTPVASSVLTKIADDVYERVKKSLSERHKAKRDRGEGGRPQGFVIYGPDGEELRRWDTREDDRRSQDDDQGH